MRSLTNEVCIELTTTPSTLAWRRTAPADPRSAQLDPTGRSSGRDHRPFNASACGDRDVSFSVCQPSCGRRLTRGQMTKIPRLSAPPRSPRRSALGGRVSTGCWKGANRTSRSTHGSSVPPALHLVRIILNQYGSACANGNKNTINTSTAPNDAAFRSNSPSNKMAENLAGLRSSARTRTQAWPVRHGPVFRRGFL
jgi:hypothetical protein